MNGLEALESVSQMVDTGLDYTQEDKEREVSIIERELKAFEIIKAKKVETYHLSRCKTLIEYNSAWDIGGMDLTQDEFDLLKEVLK